MDILQRAAAFSAISLLCLPIFFVSFAFGMTVGTAVMVITEAVLLMVCASYRRD